VLYTITLTKLKVLNPTTIENINTCDNERADLILLNQHGYEIVGNDPFLNEFPEILDAVPVDEEILIQYCKLERDFGAPELTQGIAEKVATTRPATRIKIAHVETPRGILDGNRWDPKDGVREIFDKTEHETLFEKLAKLLKQIRSEIDEILKTLNPNGVFIDIHTMAPFNRHKVVNVKPDKILEYLDSYLNPTNHGNLRHLDLITAREKQDHIADEQLLESLQHSLRSNSVDFRQNDPYHATIEAASRRYMEQYSGIAIDVPKHWLATNQTMDSVDLENVNEIAKPVTEAICDCLNKKYSKVA